MQGTFRNWTLPFIPWSRQSFDFEKLSRYWWSRVTTRTILVYSGIFTFLVDAYPLYSASALAANSFMRSSFGGIFPLFGIQSKSTPVLSRFLFSCPRPGPVSVLCMCMSRSIVSPAKMHLPVTEARWRCTVRLYAGSQGGLLAEDCIGDCDKLTAAQCTITWVTIGQHHCWRSWPWPCSLSRKWNDLTTSVSVLSAFFPFILGLCSLRLCALALATSFPLTCAILTR